MLNSTRQLQKYFDKLFPGDYEYHLNDITSFTNFLYHPDTFKKLDAEKCHIFDVSDEPWSGQMALDINRILQTSTQLRNYIVLSHDPSFINCATRPNIVFFPHNYYDPAVYWTPLPEEQVQNSKRTYFVSCLNRMPRFFRVYNYFKLHERAFYINKILLTLYNFDGSVFNFNQEAYQAHFESEIQDYWEALREQLPTYCVNDLDINHPAYYDSYINLVTETNIESENSFFSEKIWKPIASGQLFLLIGNPGSIDLLRRMGYDVFDDIFDHNRYDYIYNWRHRIDTVHEMLDELYPLNWEKIYKDTYDRRVKNIELFFSGKTMDVYGNEAAARMSRIFNQDINYNFDSVKPFQKYHSMKS